MMKILILNDEESLRKMMIALLTKAGHEVEAAPDGESAPSTPNSPEEAT